MNALGPQARQRVLSAAALVGFFVLWELGCRATGVSDLVLPRPGQIAQVLWTKWPLLWPHTLQTLSTTLTGFAANCAARECSPGLRSIQQPPPMQFNLSWGRLTLRW